MSIAIDEFKAVQYQVEQGIATITLNRPHRMNAWTGRMHTEYRSALLLAEKDPAIRIIVVTGEGRGFCVGADTKALEGHIEKGGYDPGTPDDLAQPGFGIRPEFDASFAYHFGLTKPVIAAINGPAAGVGLVLACFADIRFAATGVKLTTAHGKLNLPAEFGLSWLLPRLIGLTRANDILLTSRVVMTEEALEIGRILMADRKMADLGFGDLSFKGAPITWSPAAPNYEMRFLNTNHLKWTTDAIANLKLGEFKPIVQQPEDYVAHSMSVCNLTCDNRVKQGVLYNVGN